MIYFVICDKVKENIEIYKSMITKIMINYDIDYHFKVFSDYSSNWRDFIKEEKSFKIFLLSISSNKCSGLEVAKYIREELDDWQSMIIMLTDNLKFQYDIINKRLMLIDFIYKQEKYQAKLQNAIKIALKNYDKRPKSLKFTYDKILYNIELNKIIYIEKELSNKKCLIKTLEDTYYYSGNLTSLGKLLDERFMKCCRSIIINLEQIHSFNSKTNTIIFKNKEELNAISRNHKKDLIKYIRGLN